MHLRDLLLPLLAHLRAALQVVDLLELLLVLLARLRAYRHLVSLLVLQVGRRAVHPRMHPLFHPAVLLQVLLLHLLALRLQVPHLLTPVRLHLFPLQLHRVPRLQERRVHPQVGLQAAHLLLGPVPRRVLSPVRDQVAHRAQPRVRHRLETLVLAQVPRRLEPPVCSLVALLARHPVWVLHPKERKLRARHPVPPRVRVRHPVPVRAQFRVKTRVPNPVRRLVYHQA